MATFSDKVKVVIDVATGDSVKSIATFKKQFSEAEGAVNKFKVIGANAMSAISANAASLAASGAAAFAAFAAKGVKAFQDLALASGRFADATGLSVEEASRWTEVAGDIGIESTNVESAIGKMNKVLGQSPDLFSRLGVEIAKTSEGTVDVNETFLNVVDRLNEIRDPAQRAAVASQLLGKNWQVMAELIAKGSSSLRASLGEVSAAKVINREELEKARRFRDTMDKLGDAVSDLALMLGETLVPILSKAAEILTSKGASQFFAGMKAGWHALTQPTVDFIKDVNHLGKSIKETGDQLWYDFFGDPRYKGPPVYVEAMRESRAELDLFKQSLKEQQLIEFVPALAGEITKVTTAIVNADTAWQLFTGRLDTAVALDNAYAMLDDLREAAVKAFGSGAQQDLDEYEKQFADIAGIAETIAATMDELSSREFLLRFRVDPQAGLDFARWVKSGAELSGLSFMDLLGQAGISTLPGRANGGPVQSGQSYIVGERGPEILTMGSSSGMISPNGGRSAGNVYNITVNADALTDTASLGGKIVTAIKAYETRSGGGWRRA